MNRRPLLLLLLLLTLLNHAVLACDSVVLHGNSQHHPVSGLTGVHQHSGTTGTHAAFSDQTTAHTDAVAGADPEAEQHAQPHAHVLCFVAYSTVTGFDTAVLIARPQLQIMVPTLNTAPPVPPPNS